MEITNSHFEQLNKPEGPSKKDPVDNCDRFILAALYSKRPQNVLQLGIGNGNLLLGIAASQKNIPGCRLDIVHVWPDGRSLPSGFFENLSTSDINLIRPVSEIEFINDCVSDHYDFLILNSVESIGALWTDELLRITRKNGFLFIKNSNHAVGSMQMQLIQRRFDETGIFCYHFTESDQHENVSRGAWLFSVNNDQKNTEEKVCKPGRAIGRSQNSASPTQDRSLEKSETSLQSKLYLGLSSEGNYGWGVCSKYLIKELDKLIDCEVLDISHPDGKRKNIRGKLFQTLTGIDLFSLCENVRATQNFGYTFFEDELTPKSIENARKYDLVLAGSTWCRDRLREKGIHNCDILLQGIDPDMFHPRPEKNKRDGFVIFSGGKFELRKGQDLVLAAVKILQEKYPDIFLVNCWYNNWPQLVKTMAASDYIQFDYQKGTWSDVMNRVYSLNGLDSRRIKTFELVPYEMQPDIYARTDLGIFPNRCEGGTNLVLMEYMACGKPVIVSNTSGHKDIVNPHNALLLNKLSDFNVFDRNKKLAARWREPSQEELVDQIE